MEGVPYSAGATYRVVPHADGGWTAEVKLLCEVFEEHEKWQPTPIRVGWRGEAERLGRSASFALAAEALAVLMAVHTTGRLPGAPLKLPP